MVILHLLANLVNNQYSKMYCVDKYILILQIHMYLGKSYPNVHVDEKQCTLDVTSGWG